MPGGEVGPKGSTTPFIGARTCSGCSRTSFAVFFSFTTGRSGTPSRASIAWGRFARKRRRYGADTIRWCSGRRIRESGPTIGTSLISFATCPAACLGCATWSGSSTAAASRSSFPTTPGIQARVVKAGPTSKRWRNSWPTWRPTAFFWTRWSLHPAGCASRSTRCGRAWPLSPRAIRPSKRSSDAAVPGLSGSRPIRRLGCFISSGSSPGTCSTRFVAGTVRTEKSWQPRGSTAAGCWSGRTCLAPGIRGTRRIAPRCVGWRRCCAGWHRCCRRANGFPAFPRRPRR